MRRCTRPKALRWERADIVLPIAVASQECPLGSGPQRAGVGYVNDLHEALQLDHGINSLV